MQPQQVRRESPAVCVEPGAERLSRDARRSLGSGRERHGALGGRQNPSGEARPARALSTLAPPHSSTAAALATPQACLAGSSTGLSGCNVSACLRQRLSLWSGLRKRLACASPWSEPRAASALAALRLRLPGRARSRVLGARLNERDTHRDLGHRVVRVDNTLGGFTHCQCVAAVRTFSRQPPLRFGDFSDQPLVASVAVVYNLSPQWSSCVERSASLSPSAVHAQHAN
ncbi:hypothetical protein MRX96_007053 [Rhipicephalus microplus]